MVENNDEYDGNNSKDLRTIDIENQWINTLSQLAEQNNRTIQEELKYRQESLSKDVSVGNVNPNPKPEPQNSLEKVLYENKDVFLDVLHDEIRFADVSINASYTNYLESRKKIVDEIMKLQNNIKKLDESYTKDLTELNIWKKDMQDISRNIRKRRKVFNFDCYITYEKQEDGSSIPVEFVTENDARKTIGFGKTVVSGSYGIDKRAVYSSD